MSITVTLEASLEARLRARVQTGEFSSIDAAVEEAVRGLVLLEPSTEELRASIATAIAELDRGEGVALDADDLTRAGCERLLNRQKQAR